MMHPFTDPITLPHRTSSYNPGHELCWAVGGPGGRNILNYGHNIKYVSFF